MGSPSVAHPATPVYPIQHGTMYHCAPHPEFASRGPVNAKPQALSMSTRPPTPETYPYEAELAKRDALRCTEAQRNVGIGQDLRICYESKRAGEPALRKKTAVA